MNHLPEKLRAGRYRVLRALGEGGEGRVVLAEDRLRGGRVVLKWSSAADPDAGGVPEEFRVLTGLAHPGIVRVVDAYHDRSLGAPVLVEAWTKGEDLSDVRPARDALHDFGWQLVDALAYLHAAGLRHGDVKPSNILVASEPRGARARLIDFGMAAPAFGAELPGGTTAYFSPELIVGGAPSPAQDWYALGLTLEQIARGAPRPLTTAEVSGLENRDPLDRLVAELLRPDPRERLAAVENLVRTRIEAPRAGLELPARLPFVGRNDVFVETERRLGEALSGSPSRVVRLAGEPGVGRRRLLLALEERARARRGPVVRIEDAFTPERLEDELAVATGAGLDHARARRDRRDAERALTAPEVLAHALAVADGRPILILLGPAAVACDAGAALVAAAHGATDDEDVAFAVLVAGEATAGVDLPKVDVPPLVKDETRLLLAALFPSDLDQAGERRDAAAQRLQELTGGFPARLDRVIRAGVEQAALGYFEGRFDFDGHALGRIAAAHREAADDLGLDEGEEAVVRALEVNGGFLDVPALRDVTGMPTPRIEGALRTLDRRGIVRRAPHSEEPVRLAVSERSADDAGLRWRVEEQPDVVARLRPWLASPFPDSILAVVSRLPADVAARSDVRLLAARAHLRCDAPEDAARVLEKSPPTLSEESGLEWLLLRVSLDVRRGAVSEARTELESARRSVEPASRTGVRLRCELAYVALLEGEAETAAAHAEAAMTTSPSGADEARALTLLANAEHRRGRLEEANAAYVRATDLWDELGDPARMAACLANRGNLERAAGRHGAAVRFLKRAVDVLEHEGSPVQVASALTNLGVALGDSRRHDAAAAAHSHARFLFALSGDRARASAAKASRGLARFARGRLVSARADLVGALPGLEEAPRARSLTTEALVRLELLMGRRRRALRRDPTAADRVAPKLPDSLRAARHALRSGDVEVRLGGLAVATSLSVGADRPARAARFLERFQQLILTMEQGMSQRQKTVFRALVVNRAFERLRDEIVSLVRPSDDGRDLEPFLRVVDRIVGSTSSARSLAAVMDGVFALTPALRAFVIGAESDGDLRFLASAHRDGSVVGAPESEVSRAVIRHVFESRQPTLVADAASHERFGFAASVQSFGLQSIACLPLESAGRCLGLLYADSPRETSAFGPDTLPLLSTLARLSALALSGRMGAGASPAAESVEQLREEVTSREMELITRTRELARARERLGQGVIVGRSDPIRKVNALIDRIAGTELSVIVTGETGTGKELVAEAVHARSGRRARPFIAVNCATLQANLAESELFGHERGAFTGATKAEPGLFRLADGGTLFLDEVGELPLALQAKLLRALESRQVRPVGGVEQHAVDVRVVAATNADLGDPAVFRSDLYYRLAGCLIEIPPLRERPADIPLLVKHFLRVAGGEERTFEPEALRALEDYEWPGNIRELKNLVDRLVLLVPEETLRLTHLPETIWDFRGEAPPSLEEAEAVAIAQALRFTGGEKKKAAKLLGISRTTLYEKLSRLGPGFADNA